MKINDYLTITNYDEAINRKIEYIVIHYVGAEGGAKANCAYFYSKNRNASAHYFVGHEGEVWRCVLDKNIAWHCGANTYYNNCRNTNSIGIELCTRYINGKWVFNDKTVESAIELTKELMKKYNIPLKNVVRHYDVARKQCPAPYVLNNTKHTWDNFKNALKDSSVKVEADKKATKKTLKAQYFVRISFDNKKSQIGAFKLKSNATKLVKKVGNPYKVFNSKGKVVFEIKEKSFSVGDKVKVKKGAHWYDGEEPDSWIYNATFYVREVVRDRVVISTLKSGAITGAINIKYLSEA